MRSVISWQSVEYETHLGQMYWDWILVLLLLQLENAG